VPSRLAWRAPGRFLGAVGQGGPSLRGRGVPDPDPVSGGQGGVVSVAVLVRDRLVVHGSWTSGSLWWTRAGDAEPFATIGFEADAVDPAHAWLRLRYTAHGEPVDYRVRLTTTRPTFGGLRWWFVCPLVRRDGGPPRRVAKLYLPPGQVYFGSREAYGLTYTSCQESHGRLFRQIAAEIGTSEAAVRRALRGPVGLLS
jgi:hypothetical protein